MNEPRGLAVSWTNIRFSTERADRNSVLIKNKQVVTQTSIHETNSTKLGGHHPTEEGYETAAHQGLLIQHPNQDHAAN
jgi:hypothetical protein